MTNRCTFLPRTAACFTLAAVLMPLPLATAQPTSAERERLERELEQTREQIQSLSQRLGELSVQLTEQPLRKIIRQRAVRANRAGIGATIQSVTGERGVKIVAVTPGGPAQQAGLKTGDVIVGINDIDLLGDDNASGTSRLTRTLADIAVGTPVTIHFERDGQRLSESVITEGLGDRHEQFAFAFGDQKFDVNIDGGLLPPDLVDRPPFEFLFHTGPWSDMELVELTPGLGDYFGVADGLLVVRAPRKGDLALLDGDVITKLDGQPVTRARDVIHALAERASGETVSFDIVRQRQAMTLSARVPKRDSTSHTFKFGGPQTFIRRAPAEPHN